MKNKVMTFLCIVAFLVLGAIRTLIPVKCANMERTSFNLNTGDYYVFGLDRLQADAHEGTKQQICVVSCPDTRQYGDIIIIATLVCNWDAQVLAYRYTVEISIYMTDWATLLETFTYEVNDYNQPRDTVRQNVIIVYNQYVGGSEYGGRIIISLAQTSNNYNNFIDTINIADTYYDPYQIGQCYIYCGKYNYLFNDYLDERDQRINETLQALTSRINYFYDNSPYMGKLVQVYRYGVSMGQASPITRDWIATIFDKVTAFLNVQILPNLTFGTLLAIPLVLGVLRLVLFIWRRN